MIVFASLSGPALRISGGERAVTVFATSPAQNGDLLLLGAPEEQPTAGRLSWPGEYDVAGMTIRGIGHSEGQKVDWLLIVDGYRCALLGSPLQDWTEAQIELLGDIHVLALPAEDLKVTQKLLEEVDPRILILLPTKDGKFHPEVLKFCNAHGKETVTEYKVKGALPAEGREVVVLAK